MSSEALYQERHERIQKTIRLEPVGRIPIAYLGPAFTARYTGMPLAEYCEDAEAALAATLAATKRLDVGAINSLVVGRMPLILITSWLSHVKIPGQELPSDEIWQVEEKEVMTVEDYDFITENGWQPFLDKHFPKVADPAYLQESIAWVMANAGRGVPLFRENGIVTISSGALTIPFEHMCGGRSMTSFFVDLYRMPDRVQAAMDRAMPEILAAGIALAKALGAGGAWVGGWRAASGLVAPKLWNRFVWPYYLQIIDALLTEDITPVLHFDQDWTRDLVRLQELPAKKCILNPDGMTDIRKFKELLGDRIAMLGDVPASLLSAGTPDDVVAYVRDLVNLFGGRGLILCSGCGIPVNAKPENVEAMVAAGKEFGKARV